MRGRIRSIAAEFTARGTPRASIRPTSATALIHLVARRPASWRNGAEKPSRPFSDSYGILRKLRLLHPAAHPSLVVQVLLAEGAFQVTLLAFDHLALDHVQHQRQE